MRATLALAGLCFAGSLFAQYSMTAHKHKYFKQYLSGRVVVELTGDEGFDRELRSAAQAGWPDKTVEFLPSAEVRLLGSDCGCTVLGPMGISVSGITMSGYALYSPGLDINETRLTNMIAYVPITCASGGRGDSDYFRKDCDIPTGVRYKIRQVVMELASVARYVKERKYRPTLAHFSGIKKFQKRFNYHNQKDRTAILERKTLLVNENDLTERIDEERIENRYKHRIQVVPQAEYERLVAERDPRYLAMLATFSPLAQLSVVDLETDRMLYVDLNVKNVAMKIDRKLDMKQIGGIDHKRLLPPGTGFKIFLGAVVISNFVL